MAEKDDRNKGGSDRDRQQSGQRGTGSPGGTGRGGGEQSAGRKSGTQGGETGMGRTQGGKVGQKSGPGSPQRQHMDEGEDQGQ